MNFRQQFELLVPAYLLRNKDVAEVAGVSIKTVSRVINDAPHVREHVRQRVWEAIERLDYRPNALARGLRIQRTYTFGFISDEIGTSPYAGQILQGAQDLAWQHKNLLLSVNTGRDKQLKEAAVNALLNRQVDGIIYAAMYHRSVDPPENIYIVPTVLLNCFIEDRSLPSVVPDDEQGGYMATKLLLDRGYSRIGFANHDEPTPAAVLRLAGYQRALDEAGVPFDPALVARDISFPDGGYRTAHQLMSLAQPPNAIFCFNDRMALGAYQALQELGLKVPADVAVVGFDNQPDLAAVLRPPLTTFELPHYEMGQWAVAHLLEWIEHPERQAGSPLVQKTLVCPLVERDSA